MAQYIDKAALVAEIEKWRDRIKISIFSIPLTGSDRGFATFEYELLGKVKYFLNHFETKEVDFDALGILAEHLIACEAHGVTPKYRDGEIDLLEKLKNNNA